MSHLPADSVHIFWLSIHLNHIQTIKKITKGLVHSDLSIFNRPLFFSEHIITHVSHPHLNQESKHRSSLVLVILGTSETIAWEGGKLASIFITHTLPK